MKRYLLCFLLSSLLFPIMAQEDDFSRVIRRGIELHDQGSFDAAIKCYQEGLRIRPESMLPYYQMAYTYACMNRLKDIYKCAEKAVLIEEEIGQTREKVVYYLEALSMYITLILEDRQIEKKKIPIEE